MIAVIGRALFWLLCAMTAPRPPVPDLPPADRELLDRPMARHYTGLLDLDEMPAVIYVRDTGALMAKQAGSSAWTEVVRPRWACGNPAGFHTEHLPCSNVPPFKLTSPTLPDGSQPRRTT